MVDDVDSTVGVYTPGAAVRLDHRRVRLGRGSRDPSPAGAATNERKHRLDVPCISTFLSS
jgi:hypothetical protein